MPDRRHVIAHYHAVGGPRLPNHRPALAELLRLSGRNLRELRAARDVPEVLVHQRERLLGIEIADDNHGRVVRPVEGSVILVELVARDRLHVMPPADGRPLIRVRLERGGIEFVVDQVVRVVFIPFELRAHDYLFRLELLRVNQAVHHAVGLDAHCELELVAG